MDEVDSTLKVKVRIKPSFRHVLCNNNYAQMLNCKSQHRQSERNSTMDKKTKKKTPKTSRITTKRANYRHATTASANRVGANKGKTEFRSRFSQGNSFSKAPAFIDEAFNDLKRITNKYLKRLEDFSRFLQQKLNKPVEATNSDKNKDAA